MSAQFFSVFSELCWKTSQNTAVDKNVMLVVRLQQPLNIPLMLEIIFFYQVNSYIGALYLNQNNFRNQTIVVLFWDRFFFSFAKNQLEKEPK